MHDRPPLLQVALDVSSVESALDLASRVAPFVDAIEAGTPLIKSCGIDVVRVLKERFPERVIVADMKTMDAGAMEATMAFAADADVVTVLGAADRATIAAACDVAVRDGKAVAVDAIVAPDLGVIVAKLHGLAVGWLMVHAGLDRQAAGGNPFADLDRLGGDDASVQLAVAGGLDAEAARRVIADQRVTLIVVGAAITAAANPAAAAATIRAVLDESV